jgi:hypothetical protein
VLDFIQACIDKVDSLPQPKDNATFFRRFNHRNIYEDVDMENLFECFKISIKSMIVSRRGKGNEDIHVSMLRRFSKKEILSGKQTGRETMNSFLWSLGYKILGPGTWHSGYEPQKAKCVEVLYMIANIFHNTVPPVRSLQSLAYSFTKNLNIDTDLYENNTFNEMEGVEWSKVVGFTFSEAELARTVDDAEEIISAEKRSFIESYHFTSTFKGLEDNIILEDGLRLDNNAVNSIVIERCLVFDIGELALNESSLKHTMNKCFQWLRESSPIVYFHLSRWNNQNLWGLLISQPIHSQQVCSLMIDVNLGLLGLKNKFLQKCEVIPFVGCKLCIAREAEFDACLVFLNHAFGMFWNNV